MEDLIKLVGLPASIATVFVAVVGAFTWLEAEASTPAKERLGKILSESDWRASFKDTQKIFVDLFETVFDRHHFTIRCMLRSLIISLLFILIFNFTFYLANSELYISAYTKLFNHMIIGDEWAWFLICTFIASLFMDYITLYKTRRLIYFIRKRQMKGTTLIILSAIDAAFTLFCWTTVSMLMYLLYRTNLQYTNWRENDNVYNIITAYRGIFASLSHAELRCITSPLAYASIMPSLWFFLYVLSVKSTLLIPYFQAPFLILNARDRPLRSIGILSAIFVCLIMIFVEVYKKMRT